MPELGYWGDLLVTLTGLVLAVGLLVAIPIAIWKDANDDR